MKKIYLGDNYETDNIVENENTGIQYTNFEKAVSEVNENEQVTIKILRDFELKNNFVNIILDFNGFKITNNYFKIINNGEITLKDLTQDGELICNEVRTENYNILRLSGITIKEEATGFEMRNY